MRIIKHMKRYLVLLILMVAPWANADTQFRLIIDASGSMLISDPDKLTAESLKLISDLAPEERASLGVWLFGERSRVLLPEAMINPETKIRLGEAVNRYKPSDLRTDLESAIRLLMRTPDLSDLAPGFDRHWILVTDGMVDVSLDEKVNDASRQRITGELAQALAERGVHLHTISMTGYTDSKLLQSLSNLTDATHTEVATPEELLDTFDRVFSQASPSEEVPFEGNTFFIDDAIDEATLLVFHKEGSVPKLIQPNGQPLDHNAANVSSVTANHYSLVTITHPTVGTWRVENVDIERSNIRVITKLSAQATKIAPVLFVNEPIYSTVGLFQDGELISDDDVLNVLDVWQRLQLISGENTTKVLQRTLPVMNHQYKNKIDQITEAGNYELISTVDGKTFVRKLSQFFSVAAPIDLTAKVEGDNLVSFSAKPTNLRLDQMRSNARLVLNFSNGTEDEVEMPLTGEGYWQKVYPIQPNNTVSAYVRLIGITRVGSRFEYETDSWTLVRDAAGPVTIHQGDTPESDAPLAALGAVNRTLIPVVVTPQISVVDAEQMDEPDTTGEEGGEQEQPMAEEEAGEEPLEAEEPQSGGLDKTDWILYAALNGAGVLVLLGGYFIYRRIRKKRQQLVVEDTDV